MVGIVIVSHSARIAEGICDLAKQMAATAQKIVAAGGMTDGDIGTDALKIQTAIEEANTGDGVAVFVDLGSAVMSAEVAIDLVDDSLRSQIVIVDAPIVEGAVAGVVAASIGQPLASVVVTAEGARNLHKK